MPESKGKNEDEELKSIEELLLDTEFPKYKLTPLAARWAEELKTKEEYKYLTFSELLEVSLRDILTGKVTEEQLSKLPPVDMHKKILKQKSGWTTK